MAIKRGRPAKNGMQPGWMMLRAMELLHAYDEARKAGEKHVAAVHSAVDAVRTKYPAMPVSATAVKRMLAEWRPKDGRNGILVTKPNDIITLPDGRKARRTLIFGYGLRPNYPRVNAKTGGESASEHGGVRKK